MRRLIAGLWRALPVGPRRAAARTFMRALSPRLEDPAQGSLEPDAPRIVAGFLTSASGLGQAARLAYRAFEKAGHDVYGIDLTRLLVATGAPIDFRFRDGARLRGRGQLLVNVNAPLMRLAAAAIGRATMRGKWVTGYWAWELPRMPADWADGFAFAHRLAAPSRFVADAIVDLGWDGKVVVAPHPVALEDWPEPPARTDDRVTIVSAFNVASGFARKNPLALIAAFRAAFPQAERSVRLRLLATNIDHYAPAEPALRAAAAGDHRIEISAPPSLTRAAYFEWYGAPDLFASFHRSEGFGLGIAESMCRGVPPVATNWSGNAEFMTPETSAPIAYRLAPVDDPQGKYLEKAQFWAEIDPDDAAAQLYALVADDSRRARMGIAARAWAQAAFSTFPL